MDFAAGPKNLNATINQIYFSIVSKYFKKNLSTNIQLEYCWCLFPMVLFGFILGIYDQQRRLGFFMFPSKLHGIIIVHRLWPIGSIVNCP